MLQTFVSSTQDVPNATGLGSVSTDNEILTATELAARLSLTRRTILAMHASGRLPGLKLGPKVLRFHWPTVLRAMGVSR